MAKARENKGKKLESFKKAESLSRIADDKKKAGLEKRLDFINKLKEENKSIDSFLQKNMHRVKINKRIDQYNKAFTSVQEKETARKEKASKASSSRTKRSASKKK